MLYRNSQHTPKNPKTWAGPVAFSTQEQRPMSGEPNATRKATRLRVRGVYGGFTDQGYGCLCLTALGFAHLPPGILKSFFGEHLARNVPEEECTKAKSTTMVD